MVRGVARKSRRLLAWIAPIVAALPLAFYLGGTLLTLGAFAPVGLAGLGAFNVSELATAGWLTLGAATLVLAAVAVIAALIMWPVAALLTRALLARAPRSTGVAIGVAGVAFCAYALATVDGVFQFLIAVFALLVVATLVLAQLTRTEAAMRAHVRPLGWFVLCFGVAFGFVALGEAASPFGSRTGPVTPSLFITAHARRCVYPVLLGRTRLLYADQGRVFLSDYEERSLVQVGRIPASAPLLRHPQTCERANVTLPGLLQ